MSDGGLRVFDGAVAIVTGGASGIGRTMAEEMAKRGADVVLADLQLRLAQEVAESIIAAGGKAEAAELDTTDFEATESLVRRIAEERGRIDFMFNNAGIGIGGPVRLYQIEDWRRVLEVNLHGVVHGVQAAYPIMLRQGFGHIVNTASMAGLIAAPSIVSYATTKHAVVGLSKSLRIEAAPAGVRVSVLCPGVIRTAILEHGGKFGKLLETTSGDAQRAQFEKLRPMDPHQFAVEAIDQIAANKAIIVVPRRWKMFWWIERFSPGLSEYLSRKRYADLLRRQQAATSQAPDREPTEAAGR